ncbi:MAG: pyruvate dehydrogenase [Candidatus Limnocylindrales bacterium]
MAVAQPPRERNAARKSSRQAMGPGRLDTDVFESIERRVLWLAVRMIHEANQVRPNPDGLKVGGHQASSASMVSILSALYLHWLRPDDLVAIKPHASPVYHALRYLMGDLEAPWLTRLRAFGGLQSYPSRTKDPDRVDFSTGSVGLGAVTPMFAALADRYLQAHLADEAAAWPDRRFVATVGDAELDEGNVWEAVLEEPLSGLGNVTVLVDLNRQSLDRVVPGIRIRRLERMFAAAGWQVLEAKYGRRLEAAFAGDGGETLRRRIDDMPNEEYQALIRRPGAEIRARVVDGAAATDREDLAKALAATDDASMPALISDLGGHDVGSLVRVLDEADADRARPSVVFAYTIKGRALPFAGDPLNHSAMLTADQIAELAPRLGADPADPWAAFPDDSPEARLCVDRGRYLRERAQRQTPAAMPMPSDVDIRIAQTTSTQQVLGDTLAALARVEGLGSRIVTASPDVSVSTNLGGWINRVGVFSTQEATVHDDAPRLLRWQPGPTGQHIELGISEMDLFLWLSQFGLTAELFGEPLVPLGTVYDPFIARGLDAFIHALYIGSRFILVATPSGVTLAPEGGAHQSSVTPSLGIELPGLRAFEPAFGQEAAWCLLEAIRGVQDRGADGFSSYLRLTTRAVDQSLAAPVRARLGETEYRRQVIAGGYRLLEPAELARELGVTLPQDAPGITVVAVGAVVPEAVAAVRELVREEVAASLVVVTSADRLQAELAGRRLRSVRTGSDASLPHLSVLFPAGTRRQPLVTVLDGASHTLGFLGAAFGAPVVPLGVDGFGQSGTIGDLYRYTGIDSAHIVEAGILAAELGGDPGGR